MNKDTDSDTNCDTNSDTILNTKAETKIKTKIHQLLSPIDESPTENKEKPKLERSLSELIIKENQHSRRVTIDASELKKDNFIEKIAVDEVDKKYRGAKPWSFPLRKRCLSLPLNFNKDTP